MGSKKKVQLFGVFIGSSAAPWRADSKNICMSIANVIASWPKMRKTSGIPNAQHIQMKQIRHRETVLGNIYMASVKVLSG